MKDELPSIFTNEDCFDGVKILLEKDNTLIKAKLDNLACLKSSLGIQNLSKQTLFNKEQQE